MTLKKCVRYLQNWFVSNYSIINMKILPKSKKFQYVYKTESILEFYIYFKIKLLPIENVKQGKILKTLVTNERCL